MTGEGQNCRKGGQCTVTACPTGTGEVLGEVLPDQTPPPLYLSQMACQHALYQSRYRHYLVLAFPGLLELDPESWLNALDLCVTRTSGPA